MLIRGARAWIAVCIAAALCAAAVVPSSAYAERTIAINTGTIELALAPGAVATDSVRVANNGDESFSAMLYTSDVLYDEQGAPTYTRPIGAVGEFLRSPASWLSLRAPDTTKIIANTPYIELDPGEEVQIDFELSVPANATPGDYNTIIFFEMFDREAEGEGVTSRVSGRLGARIVLRVIGEIVDDIEAAPFMVRSFNIGSVVPYSFRVVNDGNIDKRYQPSLVILDGSESERMRSIVESSAVVYAQNQREYVGGLELENARLGRFTMRLELDYDKETGAEDGGTVSERIRKDRTFWVVPVWIAVVAVLALGLPLLWLSWRASLKSSVRKDEMRAQAREERRRRLEERHHTSFDDEIDGILTTRDDSEE